MKQASENRLIDFFQDKRSFSRQELLDYFLKTEGDLKTGTFGWRIYELKKKNILHEIKKGWYTIRTKPFYIPNINQKIKKLASIVDTYYRGARYCLWDINWLNEFTVHQFSRQILLLETEKDLQESLAYHLNDEGYPILWALKGKLLSVYQEMIIVLPLISRAPVQNIIIEEKTIMIPTLEKLLVDIYEEEKIFYFVQGAEMERIFEKALSIYQINYTTLFGYAKRRGKEKALRSFMSRHFSEYLLIEGQ